MKSKKGVSDSELRDVTRKVGGKLKNTFHKIDKLQVIELPKGVSVAAAIKHYQLSGKVEYAEPDFEVHADAMPNDPKYQDGTLWGLNNVGQNGGTAGADVEASAGWDIRSNANSIIVAVIDTGVRYTHEDLAANIWTNPGDGSHGTNILAQNNNPMDDNGHGTHVAGTIGGVGNNGIGVVGVAWQVKIMACKFLNSSGNGYDSDAIACINFAIAHGAQVINNSWGGGGFSQALMDAITTARDAGVIFVASAGNSTSNNDLAPTYPASYDVENVVTVAATDNRDQLGFFSNYGLNSVELGAPGVSIYSTYGSNDVAYATMSGTSMAAPHVAGAIALVRAQFPSLSYVDVIRRVLAATDPVSSLGWSTMTGGRLNLARSLSDDLLPYFTAMPMSGPLPLSVSFSDESVGTETSRSWDFGDGSPTTSDAAPSHTYVAPGTYTVNLTANGSGGGGTRTRQIQVYSPVIYQIVPGNYGWVDPSSISGLMTLSLGDDGVSAAQSLAFPFTYYGITYSSVHVGANGLLGFSTPGLNKWANGDLPNPIDPDAAIYPYWDDLNSAVHGAISVGVIGAAPNRIQVISWVGVPHYLDGPGATSFYTFQVLLYEGSNDIVFQYQDVQPNNGIGSGISATIGIENETGDLAAKYSYLGSALLSNGQAIRFSTGSSTPAPGSLSVGPALGLSSSGNVGGPFSPISQTYTLSNPGGSSISWTASSVQSFVSLSATSGTLAAGASTTVTVSINATAESLAAGSYSDTVTFSNTSNGNGNTSRTVTLSVTLPPIILVTPAVQDYSSVTIGSSLEKTFTVSNAGGGTLTGTASVASPFSIVLGSSYSIAAGSSASVTVRFSPSAVGLSTKTVTFTGGLGAITTVTGTGVAAPGSLSVGPSSGLSASGFVGGPFSPNAKSYTLTNPGGSSISWTATSVQPFVSLSATSGTLTPGASTTVTVSINAEANNLAAGTHTDTVSFANTSNGNGNTSRTVTLSATLPPMISVTPASQDYGSVTTGSSLDKTFTVSNTGGGTLTGIASVAAPFTVVSGGSYSVAAGASATVTVRFTPITDGSSSQSATFTGGAGASTIVTGTGVAVPAAPSNLIATGSGSNVTLQWVDNASNEDGFYIERQDKLTGSGGFTAWTQVGTVAGGTTSFSNTGLQKGFHNYRVRAYKSALTSNYSNLVQIKTQ